MPDSATRAPIVPQIDLIHAAGHAAGDAATASSGDGVPGGAPRGALQRRRRRRIRWAATSAAVVLLMISRVAAAGPRVAISAGSCPNRDAMIFALAQVLPSASIVPPTEALLDGGEPMAVVTVSDDGASYQVQVGNIARTFFDPPARCEDRAGKAAIIVALALEPPQFVVMQPGAAPAPEGPGGPQAPAAPVASAAPAVLVVPAAPPTSAFGVWFEAGGAAEYARPRSDFGGSAKFSIYDATLRFAIERGDLGLVLGTALPGWVHDHNGTVGTERLPFEVLLRLRHALGPVFLTFDAGPVLVVQHATGGVDPYGPFGFDHPMTDTELDLRGAVRLELRSEHGYGVFAEVTGSYAPRPLDLDGFTPKGWIGGGAGLMIQVR
jgi:hypothetical protein